MTDPRQEEILHEFAPFEDPFDRYTHLVALGRAAPGLAPADKNDGNLIPGCQADLWLRCAIEDGTLRIAVDSPSALVKGLATIMVRVFAGRTPQVVLKTDLYFVERLGLERQLSPTRSNGLFALVRAIRAFARDHLGATGGITAKGTAVSS